MGRNYHGEVLGVVTAPLKGIIDANHAKMLGCYLVLSCEKMGYWDFLLGSACYKSC